jgi:hypothetical protein
MQSRSLAWVRMLAVAGTVMLALAACNGSNGKGNGSATPTHSANAADAQRDAAFAFARCMRDNGNPNYPDPVQDPKGGWASHTDSGPVEPPAACKNLANQLRSYDRDTDRISGQDMDKLRQFAVCMRKTYPDFGDPNAKGDFVLPQELFERLNARDGSRPEAPCESLLPQGYKLSFVLAGQE